MELEHIPDRCIKLIQAVDIGLNKLLKCAFQNKWVDKMMDVRLNADTTPPPEETIKKAWKRGVHSLFDLCLISLISFSNIYTKTPKCSNILKNETNLLEVFEHQQDYKIQK